MYIKYQTIPFCRKTQKSQIKCRYKVHLLHTVCTGGLTAITPSVAEKTPPQILSVLPEPAMVLGAAVSVMPAV